MSKPCVLIVEDSPSLAMTYQKFLEDSSYASEISLTAADALNTLQKTTFHAILLDLNLPDQNGIDLLKSIRKLNIKTPIIVITAEPSIDIAVTAVRLGAEDFISKPVLPERLTLTLKNILERESLKDIVNHYRLTERDRFCGFIGKSPAMHAVYRILENAAASKAPVFITGDSGTGKELAAHAIHTLSQRRDKVFEALNCAAIPATLIESEIFGHMKGAFTGAAVSMAGAAARAHHGTLFLDELTEMPLELQSKLLRFIQTGTFRPLGAQQENTVDVRFVSATNRSPLTAVKEGQLREDLYYRLNVIPVHLPRLKERGDDVLLIGEHLLKKIAAEEQKKFCAIAPQVEEFFLAHSWPGNVRQLENMIRRAVVLHDAEVLTIDMISTNEDHDAGYTPSHSNNTPASSLKEVERQVIEQTIAKCNGNILKAARELQVNPSTLHRKLNRWKKST